VDPSSIISDLLFCIVAEARNYELTPFERLFVAERSGAVSHAGWHADLYLKCGCLQEALRFYRTQKHYRKLGDVSWAMGDLDSAYDFYKMPARLDRCSSRHEKDWDRLIKLSFFRSDWGKVIQHLLDAPISPSPVKKGRIILGNSEVAGTPYLKMAAIASTRLGTTAPSELEGLVRTAFGLSAADWDNLVAASAIMDSVSIQKFQLRSRPMPATRPSVSLAVACAKGDTPRSRAALEFLVDAPNHLSRAKRDVKAFLKTGREEYLRSFLNTVLLSGVASIGHSLLFQCLEMDPCGLPDAHPERLVRLYSCHPIMNKRYFGRLLELKFRLQLPLSAGDLLTGMFQKMSSIESSIKAVQGEEPRSILDYPKLVSCHDWAEMRLSDWLAGKEGARKTEIIAQIWRRRTFKKVPGPFYSGTRDPTSPRDMTEWGDLLDEAFAWLGDRWKSEIGTSPWISENRLFQLLRRAFDHVEVLQHAQPIWLAPQHLDVFIPELCLAIEYMGEQHYRPVGFFGGEAGLRQTVERDRRKTILCKQLGVNLIHVRYDEDLSERVSQIRAMYPG